MKLNQSNYQIADKDRLAEELFQLRSRRQFCFFEMDNELYFESRIQSRIDAAKVRLRLFCLILIPLSIFILMNILSFVQFLDVTACAKELAFKKWPITLLSIFLLVPCVIGWIKVISLTQSLVPGGKHNVYEADSKKAKEKYNDLMRQKNELDVQIQSKEIELAKLSKEQNAIITNNETAKTKLSIRTASDDTEEVIMEREREKQKHVDMLNQKIQEEKNKITQSENYLRDLEIEYKRVKLVIIQFAIGLILIYLLQIIPGGKTDAILGVSAYIIIIVFGVLYQSKYKYTILSYNFEQDPTQYKDYAFLRGLESCQMKIRAAKKAIFDYEQELLTIEQRENS